MLWFVGDYASFDPRNQKVSQIFASLLHEAGVDFGILYDGESNAGNDVRRVGEEGLYEVLATANVNALSGASFKSIVTTDPHSFNTIRNEYPDSAASTKFSTTRARQATVRRRGACGDPAAEVPGDVSRSMPSRTVQQGL